MFDAETKEDLASLIPTATELWGSRVKWFKGFREHAVENLPDELNAFIGDKNGGSRVTKSQLRRYLAAPFLISIGWDDNLQSVAFSFSGGETKFMADYVIEAQATLSDGFTEWEIVSLV